MKFACPNCGANIEYNFQNKNCYCEHCGLSLDIESLKANEDKDRMLEYECSSCGAKMMVSAKSIIPECSYCKNKLLLKVPINSDWIPDKILPFKISKEDVLKIFKEHCSPSSTLSDYMITAIKEDKAQISIHQMFIPCYMTNYDINYHWDKDIYSNQLETVIFQYIIRDFNYQLSDIKNIEIKDIKPFSSIFLENIPVLDAWDKVQCLDTASNIQKICTELGILDSFLEKNYPEKIKININYQKNNKKLLIPIFIISVKYNGFEKTCIFDGSKDSKTFSKNYFIDKRIDESIKAVYISRKLEQENAVFDNEMNKAICIKPKLAAFLGITLATITAILMVLFTKNPKATVVCFLILIFIYIKAIFLISSNLRKRKIQFKRKLLEERYQKLNRNIQNCYHDQNMIILNEKQTRIDSNRISENDFVISDGENNYTIAYGDIYKLDN